MSAPATTDSGTRYRFIKSLASGGMADLYVGEALAAGGVRKRVAIKRVQPRHANDDQFVQMFLNEARLASTLQHPQIVQTYDVLQVRGEYFIVMELLEGCDLQEFMKLLRGIQETLTVPQILYLIERALGALHYAHERTRPDGTPQGITHRDVSPHNLFLTYDGGIKLLDFGIAKVQTLERPTETNMLKGKVLYMAPEQCQSGAIDRRTDIYAAGIVLYRLLSGSFPNRGTNAFDTMRSIIHDAPVPLGVHSLDIPSALDTIVMRALSKNPDDRYQTARAMQLELVEVSKTLGAFVSDLDFAGLVRRIAPDSRTRTGPVATDLPADLIVGAAAPAGDVGASSDGSQEILSSDTASLERIQGVLVLQLRGSIDERLPVDALAIHLDGDLLVDTEHVTRVSSYGIRSLLALFDARRGRRGSVFHARMSAAYVEQVGMVRGLLGGGTVASFYLPFVDPQTGNTFTELIAGERALDALGSRTPPSVPCPGFPDRLGEFDDDPESFFSFGESFAAELPAHIQLRVNALETGGNARAVEKSVDAQSTTLRVLRPLTADLRWNRLIRGSEGRLVLDLERVPSWEEAGLQQLSNALESVAAAVAVVEFVAVPIDLYVELRKLGPSKGKRQVNSVRLGSSCEQCDTPRQVVVLAEALADLRDRGVVGTESCHRCGGRLILTSAVPQVTVLPVERRSPSVPTPAKGAKRPEPVAPPRAQTLPPPASSGVPIIVWALLGITVLTLFGSLALLLAAVAAL